MDTALIKILGYSLCLFSLIIVPAIWIVDELTIGTKILICSAGILTWPFMIWFRYYEKIEINGINTPSEYRRYITSSWVWYCVVVIVGSCLMVFGVRDFIIRGFDHGWHNNIHHVIIGVVAIGFGIMQIRKLFRITRSR